MRRLRGVMCSSQCTWLVEERVNYTVEEDEGQESAHRVLTCVATDPKVGKKRKRSGATVGPAPNHTTADSCVTNSLLAGTRRTVNSPDEDKSDGPTMVLPERRASMMADK